MQLCAFKLLGTLGRLVDLDSSLKTSIVNKLLQVIDHDDARIRAEALRTIVGQMIPSRFTHHFCLSLSLFSIQVNLFKCQVGLDANHYSSFVECLQDYYPEVRLAACEALFLLASHTPDR